MARGERKVVVRGPACSASAVTGWFSQDFGGNGTAAATTARPPEVDAHGFAFNSSVLWDPERWGRYPTSEPDKSQVSPHDRPSRIRTHTTTASAACVCPQAPGSSKGSPRLSRGGRGGVRTRWCLRAPGFWGQIERGVPAMKAASRLSASGAHVHGRRCMWGRGRRRKRPCLVAHLS
jgi:hypothetical protein